jgi:DNA-binding SARP family transcriptional activator
MLVLELLGTLSLRNETPPVPVSAQQKRSLGLLAILALAGKQGFPRDRIEAYLWPESSASLAQHSLDARLLNIAHYMKAHYMKAHYMKAHYMKAHYMMVSVVVAQKVRLPAQDVRMCARC